MAFQPSTGRPKNVLTPPNAMSTANIRIAAPIIVRVVPNSCFKSIEFWCCFSCYLYINSIAGFLFACGLRKEGAVIIREAFASGKQDKSALLNKRRACFY